uniref:Uncharacterized protein n=1 Tax=Podoviridae sp. ctz6O13 TaxID=2827757 RepID=A0A8S5TK73_9CAUD|nr:MAG TPA: hypothetical protein [Podoviridae sp. ctz6O13]
MLSGDVVVIYCVTWLLGWDVLPAGCDMVFLRFDMF